MSESDPDLVPQTRRKAYSYLRFSTPEQSKGDSRRRQTSMAIDYAKRHELDLDDSLTFHDEGVSGFRGKNAEIGRLADFLEAVRVGLVPKGSILLVEQLDRLSRLTPRKAMRVLESIVEAGVSVVTLNDGREYTLESLDRDPTDLLVSVLTFMRANEESATKSRRLKQAWEAKVAVAAERPVTSVMPAWLRINPTTNKIETIPERAAVVQRIFDMTLAGVGQNKIAETFNREGLPTWGVGRRRASHWRRSYIVKIQGNPAVIGRYLPHRHDYVNGKPVRTPLAPIEDYFPKVISPDTWTDTQTIMSSKGAPRGRQASAPVLSILARMAKCPKCGEAMTRVQKGARSKPTLVCTKAKLGAGCEYRSVRYSAVENRLLQVLPVLIGDRDGLDEVSDIESRIFDLENGLPNVAADIERIVDLLVEAPSPALRERLAALETLQESYQTELAALLDHREVMAGPLVGSRIGKAIAALQPDDGAELDRAAANVALRGLFKHAVVNWPENSIDLEWHLGGVCRVRGFEWSGGPWKETAKGSSAA